MGLIMPVVSYGPRILACCGEAKKLKRRKKKSRIVVAAGGSVARQDWTETSGSSEKRRKGQIVNDCSRGTVLSCWMKERKSGRSCGNGLIF